MTFSDDVSCVKFDSVVCNPSDVTFVVSTNIVLLSLSVVWNAVELNKATWLMIVVCVLLK